MPLARCRFRLGCAQTSFADPPALATAMASLRPIRLRKVSDLCNDGRRKMRRPAQPGKARKGRPALRFSKTRPCVFAQECSAVARPEVRLAALPERKCETAERENPEFGRQHRLQ